MKKNKQNAEEFCKHLGGELAHADTREALKNIESILKLYVPFSLNSVRAYNEDQGRCGFKITSKFGDPSSFGSYINPNDKCKKKEECPPTKCFHLHPIFQPTHQPTKSPTNTPTKEPTYTIGTYNLTGNGLCAKEFEIDVPMNQYEWRDNTYRYHGQFENGKMHGRGKLTTSDGKV